MSRPHHQLVTAGRDSLIDQINLALAGVETLRQSRTPKEICDWGRHYTVDHLGRVVQTVVCISTLEAHSAAVMRAGAPPNRPVPLRSLSTL